MFSKVAAPFYIPTSNVWGFQFLYILREHLVWSVFVIIAIVVHVANDTWDWTLFHVLVNFACSFDILLIYHECGI